MSLTKNVSTRLVERRVALGLSRGDAERLWGYGRRTVERLETGASRWLSLDKLAEYADSLGMDVQVELKERRDYNPTPANAELNCQQFVLNRFIKGTMKKYDRLPRLDELMVRLGVKNKSSVKRNLLRLKDHGLIDEGSVNAIMEGV
jgi:hypothetical protein